MAVLCYKNNKYSIIYCKFILDFIILFRISASEIGRVYFFAEFTIEFSLNRMFTTQGKRCKDASFSPIRHG